MPKRCIGIDIGRTHLCAAQVARTAEGFHVEKAFARQTRRSTDSLPALLHSLTDEHGFDRRAEVAVSLPLHTFFFADIEADARKLERVRTADITELKDYFPLPADQLITQVCSVLRREEGKYSTLVAACAREQLHEALQSLRDGKIQPACLDTPITAVQAALAVNYAESMTGLAVVLYVDETTLSLAVTREGGLLVVRNIPVFSSGEPNAQTFARQAADLVAQEIEITWRRLFGNAPDPGLRLFLVAPGPRRAPLASHLQEKIGGPVIPVDPYAQVGRAEDVEEDLPVWVAEGLALRTLQPCQPGLRSGAPGTPRVDFLAAYRARTRSKLRIRRELTVCAALAAAAAVVWGAGLFLHLSALESRYEHLKQQAQAIFRQAVPEETNIIDPVAQLQQRLDAFRKEGEFLICLNSGQPAPLEILDALSRHTPATAGLKLQDVLIVADSVRIKGSCDSFATFSQWQRLLETIPGWQVVGVPHQMKDPQSGRVQFTLSLSTTESKA